MIILSIWVEQNQAMHGFEYGISQSPQLLTVDSSSHPRRNWMMSVEHLDGRYSRLHV